MAQLGGSNYDWLSCLFSAQPLIGLQFGGDSYASEPS